MSATPMPPPAAVVTTLGRRHIYILPTRHGCLFALMLLVMLLGSINYNNSLGYLLTFLLASMAMTTMLHTYHNLAGLSVTGGRTSPAFQGGQAVFGVLVDNRAGGARYCLELARHGPRPARSWRRRQLTWLRQGQDISRGSLRNLDLVLPARQRGALSLGPVRLSSCFPLGLFRAWCWVDPGLKTLVYPRPAGSLALPLRGEQPAATSQHGQRLGADDFIGFRPYRPGDPPRNIAWKALARGNTALVKRFSGNGGDGAELDWDELEPQPGEARLSQLCQWVLEASRLGMRFSLRLPGEFLPTGGGEAHRDNCLRVLALYPRT